MGGARFDLGLCHTRLSTKSIDQTISKIKNTNEKAHIHWIHIAANHIAKRNINEQKAKIALAKIFHRNKSALRSYEATNFFTQLTNCVFIVTRRFFFVTFYIFLRMGEVILDGKKNDNKIKLQIAQHEYSI